MHFDDRLETVLRLPDSGDGLARIQYRQLIDIIGRLPGDAQSETLDAGFAKLTALASRIPASDRARLLRQPLQPIINARLLSHLVEAEPDVASAAIGSARLDDTEWLALIPALPVRARGILRHRRDLSQTVETLLETLGVHDRGLPPATLEMTEAVEMVETIEAVEPAPTIASPASAPAPAPAPEPTPASPTDEDEYISEDVLELLDMVDNPPPPTSLTEWAKARATKDQMAPAPSTASADAGIGAIVRRIEEFRKAREAHGTFLSGTDAPQLPLGDGYSSTERRARSIDFTTDQEGRIRWADGPYAAAVFGLSLIANDDGTLSDPASPAAAIRQRVPLRAARLLVDGAAAVSGEWQIDALPLFEPITGRFIGYCGRLRRPVTALADATADASSEAGRMREILHELRTPANAIQVAAEIIQQQLYGPAPHEYRALAAAIASDCAHILAGFEELDRLVKLETGALQLEAGECDMAQILAQTVSRLRSWTDPRRSGFAIDSDALQTSLTVALDSSEADLLVWRLFAAIAGATAPDETLALSWTEDHGGVAVRVALPAALAARPESELFSSIPGERGQSLSAGMFGIGFALRLGAAEAAAAGGRLYREDNLLCLWLPGLTPVSAHNSSVANQSH